MLTTEDKLKEYRDRLSWWKGYCLIHPYDLSHRNLCKPKPEEFGLTSVTEKFVAQKVHDQVTSQ
jgi:hypothetical protein